MQGVFHEISKSSFNVFILLLASTVWSERTQFKEYPSPCRLTTLLQTLDLQGKSLTVCAAMCSQLSGCATFSYHGNSYICELADRDAFGDGCSDTAETAGWRTFGRKGNMSRDATKTVFGASDQVRHKPACIVTEKG